MNENSLAHPRRAVIRRRCRATIAALALGVCAMTGCTKPKVTARPVPPPVVLIAPVLRQDVPMYREWIAQLNGSVNAQISPKISGYLLSRRYEEGSFIAKGDVLFEIDPRPYQAALDQAKAVVAGAIANLGKSKLDVARDIPLARQRAIAQSQLDNDIQMMAANQAALDAAVAQQRAAELNLEWTHVRSPLDGIAGVASAQVGDLVSTTTVLTSVSQLDPIRAYFSVSEKDYLVIAPRLSRVVRHEAGSRALGAKDVQFIQANGVPFPAHGRFVLAGREVSAGTGTIQFATEFDNANILLRPGGFGRIRMQVGTQKAALLVPQKAVNEIQGQYQLMVIDSNRRAEIRPITVGERSGPDWVVISGVQAGEQVVVEGFQKVRPGMTVNPQPYVVKAAVN